MNTIHINVGMIQYGYTDKRNLLKFRIGYIDEKRDYIKTYACKVLEKYIHWILLIYNYKYHSL